MHTLRLPQLNADLCYHDLAGCEPVCVYLHGLGSAASADFPAVVRDPGLARYRGLLVDLLGFGFSDRPEAFRYTLESHAATVIQLIEHLGLQTVHLIGHSLGGSVAIALAARRPDLVAGLVVLEPNLEPEDATLSRLIASQTEESYVATGHATLLAEEEVWATKDATMASYPKTLRTADARAMHRSAVSLVTVSLQETFFGLSMPRTYVFGALTLPHQHEALLRSAGVDVAVVPDVGHGITANPGGLAQVLREALAP